MSASGPPESNPQTNARRSFLSDRRFSNANVRDRLSNSTLTAIRDRFGHERLSKVQALTFDALMAGRDVFAVSKTGSGKTMAFLLPVVERALQGTAAAAAERRQSSQRRFAPVYGIVVSPTKELAAQTYEEAAKLLGSGGGSKGGGGGVRAELVIGGNSRSADLKALSASPSGGGVIVVATPGRLEDHVANTPGFAAEALATSVRTVVLDEADRMLDAGFKKPLEAILRALPRDGGGNGASPAPELQTVMVTATTSPEVRQLATKYMKRDAATIDVAAATGDSGQASPRVNPAVAHRVLVAPHALVHHAAVQAICEHAAARPEFKVIAFYPFKRQVQLMGELLRQVLPSCLGPEAQVLEIHSDLAQPQRDRASAAFRHGRRAVLLGTDVVARGVDYPDVTFVLQVGLTDRDTYVHRVGRTGRAGRSGEALLVIAPFEEPAMRKRLEGYGAAWLRAEDPERSRPQNARARIQAQLPPAQPVVVTPRPLLDEKAAALARKQPGLLRRAYTAWLGFYGSEAKDMGVRKERLEEEAAAAYAALGVERPPEISPQTRKKMGYPPPSPSPSRNVS